MYIVVLLFLKRTFPRVSAAERKNTYEILTGKCAWIQALGTPRERDEYDVMMDILETFARIELAQVRVCWWTFESEGLELTLLSEVQLMTFWGSTAKLLLVKFYNEILYICGDSDT